MKVVVSNAGQHHAYQTALALHEGHMLQRFITGIYDEPSWVRARWMRSALNRFAGEQDVRRLDGRHQAGLPSSKVTSIYWPELIEAAVAHGGPLRRVVDPASATFFRHAAFDTQAAMHVGRCDVVHAFEQCALHTMRRAKRHGATAVLDEPIMQRGELDRLEAQERDAMGVAMPHRPAGHDGHVARKALELEEADYLFTGLEFVRRSYIDAGFPQERVFMVPYGADVSASAKAPDRGGRSGLNILYVGQISWWKGLHLLLDAFDGLEIPGATLTVIGMAHREWLDYFGPRFARDPAAIRHLGRVPSADMQRHFDQADVMVFPSLVGGIGLAVYQAMAQGLPVITSDGDVVIRDGIDGLVADPHDLEALRQAIRRLWADPALRARIGAQAVERIREFTWARYREGIRSAYSTVCEGRR